MAGPETHEGQFPSIWQPFRDELGVRLDKLEREFVSAWEDLVTQTGQVRQAYGAALAREWTPGQISSLEGHFKHDSQALLVEPLRGRLRAKPLQRILSAIEDFNAATEDLVRRLPQVIQVSGSELAENLGQEARGLLRKRWLRWRRAAQPLHLRRLVSEYLQKEVLRRAVIDGAFQLLLARTSLQLLQPWQTLRQRGLRYMARVSGELALVDSQRNLWIRRSQEYEVRTRRLLARYQEWTHAAPRRLAGVLLKRRTPRAASAALKKTEKLQRYFAFWSRQQRAVQAILELELDLRGIAVHATQAGAEGLQSLEQEHAELLQELEAVIVWLESAETGLPSSNFPAPQARLMSAEDRISVWVREVSAQAKSRLPAALETIEPRRALPGWRSPWSQLEPESAFLQALEGSGRRLAVEGFREAEAAHRTIVREIERAREVVAFGLETARAEGADALEVAEQGIRNAIELLRYQRKSAFDVRPGAEASLAQGTSAALLECHIALEQGRLGLLTHLAREAGERGVRQLWGLAIQSLRSGSLWAWRELGRFGNWLLYRIGLRTPPPTPAAAVARTGRLGQILELQVSPRALPMIYRRLFRLAPVEDPRFLVGREAEMAGLADAREQWETDRAVSVLVVGARGSGKTSLLNCAELSAFDGYSVVRGQFSDRITSPDAMGAFLRKLLEIPDGVDLVEALSTDDRRVIMIEELERTYLRRMNGFQALRNLLELVSLTWRTTLWVLSLNETAFQYLHAAVGFGRFFSYRINAMAVKQEDLQNAILLRHNLSGYRLDFAPPAEADPHVARLRRVVGFEKDRQEIFFDSLYRQSEGIFRSAFELWQHYIERVEGGVLRLRQPVDPEYGPLISAFTAEDYFTLQAILQHGSLTSDAHAEIFRESEEVSRSRLERLKALEILEADPGAPGLRVRPEAGRLVREALHQQNL